MNKVQDTQTHLVSSFVNGNQSGIRFASKEITMRKLKQILAAALLLLTLAATFLPAPVSAEPVACGRCDELGGK